jgi:hypothetical protein
MEDSTEKSTNLTSGACDTGQRDPGAGHSPDVPTVPSGCRLQSACGKLDFFVEKQELETDAWLCIGC